MKIKPGKYFWEVIMIFSTVLFVLNSIVFVIYGRVNADEGWYLYASKLVYEGQYPYQDFAFTQTPLLPYIYGIPQSILFQSLYLGRITSVAFSAIALLLSVAIACNYGNKIAGAITSLLGATFTFGIYFQSITKTYALTTFFFMLAFFVLSSKLKQNLMLILSTLFVILATLTRLTAVFFAIPYLVYAFAKSDTRNRIIIIAICFTAVAWIAMLASHNIDAATWGLITHHTSRWGNMPIGEKIMQILESRIPALLITFPQYILVLVITLSIGFIQIKNNIQNHPAILTTTIGSILFFMPNLMGGGFYPEYFVPFIFMSFPILGIVYEKILHHQNYLSRTVMKAVLISIMVLSLIWGGFSYIDKSGGDTPINEITKVSAIIKNNTTPGDKVFLLEPLWLAIESGRQVMPNMTMAKFSFYETDTDTDEKLHLINSQMIFNYVENRIPKVIAFTDLDHSVLQNTSNYQKIISSLEANYLLIFSADNFGPLNNHIDIYIRKVDK